MKALIGFVFILIIFTIVETKKSKKKENSRYSWPLKLDNGPVPFPKANGYVKLTRPIVVKAGTIFDGKMKRYDTGTECTEQILTNYKMTGVFLIEKGATLMNVIIGPKQSEGIRCVGTSCKIKNVWWERVCEDGLSIDLKGNYWIDGGGMRNGEDKGIQVHGGGTLTISNFYGYNIGRFINGGCGKGNTIPAHFILNNITYIGEGFIVAAQCACGNKMTIRGATVSNNARTCIERGASNSSGKKKGLPSCCKASNIKRSNAKEPKQINTGTSDYEAFLKHWIASKKSIRFPKNMPKHVKSLIERHLNTYGGGKAYMNIWRSRNREQKRLNKQKD